LNIISDIFLCGLWRTGATWRPLGIHGATNIAI